MNIGSKTSKCTNYTLIEVKNEERSPDNKDTNYLWSRTSRSSASSLRIQATNFLSSLKETASYSWQQNKEVYIPSPYTMSSFS